MKGSDYISKYIFIASNNKLSPLEVGLRKNNKSTIIENENGFLLINDDEPNCCTAPFTNLPEIRHVQIGLIFSEVEMDLLNYIKNAMKENEIVELWHTWMGETEHIEKKTRNIDELSISDVRWVFEDSTCTHPRGLKVFKWVRGNK